MEDEIVDENHYSSIFGNYPLQPRPFPVGPALEVISISIFNPHHSTSQISGQITTRSHSWNNTYYFYYSDKTIQLINPGWNSLPLTGCSFAPVMGGLVKFQLTDESGVSVLDNVFDMNKAVKRQDGTYLLQGDDTSGYRFKMIFTKTPFAVIAKVEMLAKFVDSDPSEEYYHLYGKITTNKFTCLHIEHDKALRLKNGREIYLPVHRNWYAVPVDSALVVEVEWHNGGRCIMDKKREVDASRRSMLPVPPELFFGCEVDKRFDFAITVEWNFHEDFFGGFKLTYSSFPTALVPFKSTQPRSPGALVEVFSVFSAFGNSSASCGFDLYGAIVVCEGDEKFNILAGNKDCPVNLLSSSNNDEEQFRTLSLKWPDGKWVVGEKFQFYLKLKDVEGKLVCVGKSSWNSYASRYDLRLCDVFKGVEGCLTAVHYSVFKNGKKAKVSIECCNGPYSIYGSVSAKYKGYDYSSRYDEQCYQSTLFKRTKEDALEVTSSQMSLLKSQVSAPSDCDELIVCVDLWVHPLREPFPSKRFSFKTNDTNSFCHQRYRFNTSDTKSCDMFWGTRDDRVKGRLNVKVDWV